MNKRVFSLGVAFVLMLAAVLVAPARALADGVDYAFSGYSAEDLAPGQKGTISLDYDNPELDGVSVDLYRIADVSVQGFTFASDFKPYVNDVEWMKDGQTASGADWDVAAETLIGHALADGVSPMASSSTNAGKVSFDGLSAGLYMLKAHNTTIGGSVYTFSPSIVALPSPGVSGAAASYVVAAEPKSSAKPVEPRSMRIVKHWVAAPGSDAVRSVKSITVQLLRDGVAWGDPIELSDANGWSYSWKDDEGTHEWTASEQAVSGSSVVWSRQVALAQDNTIVLTNTEVTNVPPKPPTQSRLPQTGEQWSAVPALLIAAFVVLGASRILRAQRFDHESRN